MLNNLYSPYVLWYNVLSVDLFKYYEVLQHYVLCALLRKIIMCQVFFDMKYSVLSIMIPYPLSIMYCKLLCIMCVNYYVLKKN